MPVIINQMKDFKKLDFESTERSSVVRRNLGLVISVFFSTIPKVLDGLFMPSRIVAYKPEYIAREIRGIIDIEISNNKSKFINSEIL